MVCIPGLHRDVESVIFSYLIYPRDICSCRLVAREWARKILEGVAIIESSKPIRIRFLLRFPNLKQANTTIITGGAWWKIWKLINTLTEQKQICLRIVDSPKSLDEICRDMICNRCRVPFRLEDATSSRYLSLGQNSLDISGYGFDLEGIYSRIQQHWYPIEHISLPFSVFSIRALMDFPLKSITFRGPSFTYMATIIHYVSHATYHIKNLQRATYYEDTDFEDDVIPALPLSEYMICNRPFSLYAPIRLRHIPIVMHCFPQLEEIVLWVSYCDCIQFHEQIRETIINRGIRLILVPYDFLPSNEEVRGLYPESKIMSFTEFLN